MTSALFPGMEPKEPPEPPAPPALRTFIYETIDGEHEIDATAIEFYPSGHVAFLREAGVRATTSRAVATDKR
ncbi:hypothetical protein [Arthrobacter sp. RCC_34]|uniref:hypothetical protein n=1 Tax=Arthrobacter sp. RCC_34 TaxID=3239230 RepID=UPI0035257320